MTDLSGTGAREAEGSGVLSRPVSDGRVGSNPTPSASECATTAKRGVVPALESKAADGVTSGGPAAPPSRKQPPLVVSEFEWLSLEHALLTGAPHPLDELLEDRAVVVDVTRRP